MCGRFTLTTNLEGLEEAFPGVHFPTPYAPRYNIAPGQPILMIEAQQPAEAKLAIWGFLPAWAKPQTDRVGPYLNARTETASIKPAFRAAWRSRRCLIPADGFYEWQKVGGRSQVWHFCLPERRPFAFGGLWEIWQGAEEESILTCLILTVPANEVVRPVHERMPLILLPQEYEEWLYPARQENPARWVRPFPSEGMTGYRVGSLVNRSDAEGPDLIRELTSEP
ncbi:MAG: SOS response-associated peptidase [Anaerolineales bacterium]